jgi:hypothetical protein
MDSHVWNGDGGTKVFTNVMGRFSEGKCVLIQI